MPLAAIENAERLFEFEPHGNTIVAVPLMNLRESDFERIEDAARDFFELVSRGPYRNVVFDFSKTDFYGSTALGFFVKIWKWAKRRNGRFALCNLSEHEKEVLQVAHFNQLWPICETKNEALKAVEK
jgi:anti-anti-sigma factor